MGIPYKRWYDSEATISQAIRAWEAFPHPLQLLIAQHINSHIYDHWQNKAPNNGLVDPTITQHRLLGLFLSGAKRRWHDQDPEIRTAMNALACLNIEEQRRFATQILQIRNFMEDHTPEDENNMPADLHVAILYESIQRILNTTA